MYLRRRIDTELVAWKASTPHKPLLLRGARQVGKSSSIRHLGENFANYIEVNFEKRPELKDLFRQTQDVREITARLGQLYNVSVKPGETLLFLDEIQACEEALKSLWFFKEDYPELHVVAAGSLLEFTLKEVRAYGVGRIRSMFMYPLSFDEFLWAQGKEAWVEAKEKADGEHPLFDALHADLVQAFRTFLIVGGMPASVAVWTETHDYQACADEQEDIQQTYYDDFAKYAKKVDPALLRNTLQSAVMQVGKKFVYSRVEGGYRAEEVKKALGMLCDAGILKPVRHSAANGVPLGAETNNKFCKYIYLDSGLLLRILDLDFGGAREITELILAGTAEDLVNKGALAEMVAGWELVKAANMKARYDLYYWENLERGTTSEIDYVISRRLKVLPVEVKAGTSGKMKSLHLFMRKKHLNHAVRSSLENFGILEHIDKGEDGTIRRIEVVPLYALGSLMR